jgi:hypothetical protein
VVRRRTFRLRNPTPLQWGVLGVVGALGIGATAAAIGASRRKLPSVIDDEDEPPVVVDPDDPDRDPDAAVRQWRTVTPNDPGYPWSFPAVHFQNYPTPGTFFNANITGTFNPASGFDALVRALLGSTLAMAGMDPGIANAEGQAQSGALGRRLRRAVREAVIVVGGWNDLCYGQENLNYAGGNDPNAPGGDPSAPRSAAYVLNDRDRGLNWLPRHADNLQLLGEGRPARRTTDLEGESLPPPARGNRQMLVWLPAFDLDALASSPSEIAFGQWPDGSSTINPPPAVASLGVDLSNVDLPGVEVIAA